MKRFFHNALSRKKLSRMSRSWAKDVQKQLAQLILLNGFQTCPDTPGVEKLCGTTLNSAWLSGPNRTWDVVQDLSLAPTTFSPESIFCVKGWNRSICCLTVLYAAFDSAELLQAWVDVNICHILCSWFLCIFPQQAMPSGVTRILSCIKYPVFNMF